jgi:hypothetical protein
VAAERCHRVELAEEVVHYPLGVPEVGEPVDAAVLVVGAGLAIIRSMWGMRAPLARGASSSTETLWLVLPLAMSVALVAWTAWIMP